MSNEVIVIIIFYYCYYYIILHSEGRYYYIVCATSKGSPNPQSCAYSYYSCPNSLFVPVLWIETFQLVKGRCLWAPPMCGHQESNWMTQQTICSSPCLEAELAKKLHRLLIDAHVFYREFFLFLQTYAELKKIIWWKIGPLWDRDSSYIRVSFFIPRPSPFA